MDPAADVSNIDGPRQLDLLSLADFAPPEHPDVGRGECDKRDRIVVGIELLE
ncbi:hypothetical protein [Embleya sp. MST-111070]|uniref:hypothetical protein n=1 Tax=Embleya sp. MST-111070 TaxID=3398231 RepID=UPI003F738D17